MSRHERLQALVDETFAACMERDERTLGEIRAAVRARLAPLGLSPTETPTDHELQIAISRNATGSGEWEYYPAYSTPPRYVSRRRVMQLVRRAEEWKLTPAEARALQEMLADLESGIRHWRAKHARARAKEDELRHLVTHITNRAFRGFAGVLL